MLRSIWYVATRGSVFARRTSFAAIPIPIKSSELKSSSASCCVRPIFFAGSGVWRADPFCLCSGRLQAGAVAFELQLTQVYRIIAPHGSITLRDGPWTRKRRRRARPRIPVVEDAESVPRLPLFHSRDSGRRDIPPRGRNECCPQGSARARGGACPA